MSKKAKKQNGKIVLTYYIINKTILILIFHIISAIIHIHINKQFNFNTIYMSIRHGKQGGIII